MIPNMVSERGNCLESDLAKAEAISAQYASVYTVESDKIPSEAPSGATISTSEVNPEVIKKALTKLDIKKAPGPDGVHPALLKALCGILLHPLTVLFTKSLEQGKLPLEWKRGVIKPMFKGRDPCIPGNYRPVTLTSVIGKVLERLIKEQLESFLSVSGQLTAEQYGFTKGRSCLTNLLTAR